MCFFRDWNQYNLIHSWSNVWVGETEFRIIYIFLVNKTPACLYEIHFTVMCNLLSVKWHAARLGSNNTPALRVIYMSFLEFESLLHKNLFQHIAGVSTRILKFDFTDIIA